MWGQKQGGWSRLYQMSRYQVPLHKVRHWVEGGWTDLGVGGWTEATHERVGYQVFGYSIVRDQPLVSGRTQQLGQEVRNGEEEGPGH